MTCERKLSSNDSQKSKEVKWEMCCIDKVWLIDWIRMFCMWIYRIIIEASLMKQKDVWEAGGRTFFINESTDGSVQMNVVSQNWSGISARHLFALAVVCADVGEFPADVEQHVVLSRSPLLHEVRGEHPGPEHDAVIFKTACRAQTHNVNSENQNHPDSCQSGRILLIAQIHWITNVCSCWKKTSL